MTTEIDVACPSRARCAFYIMAPLSIAAFVLGIFNALPPSASELRWDGTWYKDKDLSTYLISYNTEPEYSSYDLAKRVTIRRLGDHHIKATYVSTDENLVDSTLTTNCVLRPSDDSAICIADYLGASGQDELWIRGGTLHHTWKAFLTGNVSYTARYVYHRQGDQ